MTESQFTCKLLKLLRQAMPDAVVLKHNDAMTSGIPDFSVSLAGRTLWVEVKLSTAARNKMFAPLQVEMIYKLRGRYVIYNPKSKFCHILAPVDVERILSCGLPVGSLCQYSVNYLVLQLKELF